MVPPSGKTYHSEAALAVSKAFDQAGVGPGDLDLVEFTKLYLKRIKKEEDVNFIIAGKLVLMAWSVLKLQSDKVLQDADRGSEVEEFYFDGWDIMEPCEEQSEQGYSQMVLDCDTPIISEAVRNTSTRQVTLISLLEAFDEARQEIELKKRIGKFLDEPEEPFCISEKLHQENLEENISITWQRIYNCEETTIPITQIWNSDPLDRVHVFVSSLFLANMKKITLSQSRFPYGEIMIKNVEGIMDPIVPEIQAQPMVETESIEEPVSEGIGLEELAVV